MTKKKTDGVIDSARTMGDELMKTGRNVYLAGLGMVATANDEVRATYTKLVNRGETFEGEENPLSQATDKARDFARMAEDRVQKTLGATLNRAGVPNRDEIRTLIHRVEELTEKVDRMAAAR